MSSQSVSSTSRSLLERVRADEPQAWRDVVKLYSPLLAYWCRRAGLADQDIPDIVQEVFRAVVGNIEQFRNDRAGDTFRGWLRTITRNKVNDHFRRTGAQPHAAGGSIAAQNLSAVPDADDEPEADDEELREHHALFRRAIELIREDFHPRTWTAFWRTVVEGDSTADVAGELEMKAGAVRVAKSRVLHRLRQTLGDVLD